MKIGPHGMEIFFYHLKKFLLSLASSHYYRYGYPIRFAQGLIIKEFSFAFKIMIGPAT